MTLKMKIKIAQIPCIPPQPLAPTQPIKDSFFHFSSLKLKFPAELSMVLTVC